MTQQHGWDGDRSMSGTGVCLCGWSTHHYPLANDRALDLEFDAHLAEMGVTE